MDITEHKKLEQQLFRAQRLESLGTLASGIAHDLNNVLAPIAMSLELFRAKFPDRNATRLLDSLDSCVQRGADLIRQILTFARGVQGDRVPVQTRHLLSDTEKVLTQTFPKSMAISCRIQSDLWAVNADVTQLHQVLMNLCVNARDAMPDGGSLTISAQNALLDQNFAQLNPGLSPGAYVCIEITDTGHGIPVEIRDKIFEPFFTTKEMGSGTGLGLSTVAAILKNHGGIIKVSSEVGVGTSFRILFPALPGQSSEAQIEGSDSVPSGRNEVILVVDDEAAVRDITKLTLENHGYRVLVASDGAEGVAVYSQHQDEIKLVISDQDMPVMNGAAMIRSLEKINPNVRVISASGLAANSKMQPDPQPSGLRVLLTKPFTAEELLRAVHGMLRTE
jgi:nitrogen-specific signal transduction histidine kinase/CheY-like chemotaxis protein